jgi:hypothetical protein
VSERGVGDWESGSCGLAGGFSTEERERERERERKQTTKSSDATHASSQCGGELLQNYHQGGILEKTP